MTDLVLIWPLLLIVAIAGALVAYLLYDRAAHRRTDRRLRQLSRAVEQSPTSVVITDTRGTIEYVNPKFVELTGYTLQEAKGQNPRMLQSGLTSRETYHELWTAIQSGREWRGEFVNRKKNGELYYESAVIAPITNSRGVTTHYVAIKEDITRQKVAEQLLRQANAKLQAKYDEIHALQGQLQEQAIRDSLTGLFNRRYLDETLERELAAAHRSGHPVGIIMFDIDRFKELNDRSGHGAGDKLLAAIGDLVRARTREMDIACRYGGEEFVVIMPGTTIEVAAARAEELRLAVAGLRVLHLGRYLTGTISVGVAAYPLNGREVDGLLRAADAALYAAKDGGRNEVRVAEMG